MNKQIKIKSDVKRIKDPVIKERLLMVQSSYNEPLRNVAKTFGYTHGKLIIGKSAMRNRVLEDYTLSHEVADLRK